ncbi:MAG TPA: hypothetical protein VFN61_01490 [Acidimicrobiales bacterium]|nr:hypothetical protein [Acidimicrobiales bacterium]
MMRVVHTSGNSSGKRLVRPVVRLLGIGAFGLALVGCHGPGLPTVGLANCYQDIPLAEAALNAPPKSYHFAGVRLVKPQAVARIVKHRFPGDHSFKYVPAAGEQVCAFAFTGHFSPGQVSMAPPGKSGSAAIVMVTTKRSLLFSFLLPALPADFSQDFSPHLSGRL